MKTSIQIALTGGLMLLAANARPAAGTSAAEFLKVSPDSRSAALGNTGSADATNGFAAFLNPSLPAMSNQKITLSAGQTQWILDSQVSHYAANLRRETKGGAWGAAFTLSQWDLPSFQTTDNLGNKTGSGTYGARSAGLSLSRSWGGRFAVGAGVKQVTHGFQGSVNQTGTFLAYDAGVFARSEEGRLSAGAVMQNLGGNAALGDGAADKLPTTMRAGLEFRPGDKRFAWTAEASHTKGAGLSAGAGVGFSPMNGLMLRAGYDGRVSGGDYAGLTSGIGLNLGRFTLDYAFSPFGQLGNVQRISATWAYGGAVREERRTTTRNTRKAVRARAGELNKWRIK